MLIEQQFESILILPKNKNRIDEGGIRTQKFHEKNYSKKPLVSIITVVYNDEKCLEGTILSVLNQSYKNFEYIVIDGGSTDKSLNIIKKYNDSINYWVSEKDFGIYHAMNKGCKLALGDGLIFLNSGDKFVGNVLNEKLQFPCLLPCKVKEKNGEIWDKKISNIRYGMPTSHQAMIFNNKKILYNLSYKISSDYDFFIRHGSFVNFNSSSNGYVLYNNSGVSKTKKWQRDFETIVIIYKHFGLLTSFIFLTKKIKKMIYKMIGIKWH